MALPVSLSSIIASLDATFEESRAECDATRVQHGEWLRETLEMTEKQLLNHMCVPVLMIMPFPVLVVEAAAYLRGLAVLPLAQLPPDFPFERSQRWKMSYNAFPVRAFRYLCALAATRRCKRRARTRSPMHARGARASLTPSRRMLARISQTTLSPRQQGHRCAAAA